MALEWLVNVWSFIYITKIPNLVIIVRCTSLNEKSQLDLVRIELHESSRMFDMTFLSLLSSICFEQSLMLFHDFLRTSSCLLDNNRVSDAGRKVLVE